MQLKLQKLELNCWCDIRKVECFVNALGKLISLIVV